VKLSVKVDYACRVLAQLARRHGREDLAHIEELAKIEAVPATYLVQILGELRTGVLELGAAVEGQSGKRVAQAWREVRGVLEAKCREITLEKLAAKSGGEMYYI
jgi:DNA-binding IscR family transcriptional regulator